MGGENIKKKSENQILFQYLRDKKKRKKEGDSEKKGGMKTHPFHLPWIRTCVME